MAWRKILLVAVAAAVISVPTVAQFRGFADGGFVAQLSGTEEVPPVDTLGHGQVLVGLNNDGSGLRFKLLAAKTEDITQAHIHCGPRGANGPVVAFLFGFISGGVKVNGILAEGNIGPEDIIPRPDNDLCPGGVADLLDLVAKMEAGEAYVNVHTIANPPGEIRGQLQPVGR